MLNTLERAMFLLPGLIVGLTVHEAAHAWSAKKLGDDTAYMLGRVSLNPFRHLSLMGTAALFLIGIGWGRPVPVNIRNFTKPKFHYLLTSLAGPASNLIIAAFSLGVLYLNPHRYVVFVCVSFFMINSMLAVFNLLPIPPLDGSKIWPCLIPGMSPSHIGKIERYGVIIFIAAIATGAVGKVMDPALDVLSGMMPGCIDCRPSGVITERPEDFPDELVAPKDAAGTVYMQFPEEAPTSYALSYNEVCPADSMRLSLEEQFSGPEWVKLKYNLENPNEVYSDDWEECVYENTSNIYSVWSCAWVNEKYEVARVHLTHSPDIGSGTGVVLFLYMDTNLLDTYIELHPDEFEFFGDKNEVDMDIEVEQK